MSKFKNLRNLAAATVLALSTVAASTVVANAAAVPAPAPLSKVSLIGSASDLVAVNTNGDLVNHGTDGRSNKVIGRGWKGYSNLTVTDWNKDGVQDIVALAPDNNVYVYPGTKVNTFSARKLILSSQKGAMVKAVNMYNYGYPQLLVRSATGNLRVYITDQWGITGFNNFGNGWGVFTSLNVADFDQDGKKDIIAVNQNGAALLYRGKDDYSLYNETRKTIATGWKMVQFYQIEQVNNFAGTGTRGLIALGGMNSSVNYIGESKNAFAAPRVTVPTWAGTMAIAAHSN